jgi:hypothetical protein
MPVPYATPASVTGRLLEAPHITDAGGGFVAGFLIQVEQRFKPRNGSAPNRYRVVCAGRWTELVRCCLRQGSPVFVDGGAIEDCCASSDSANPHWLLADEVIPLGRFPNPEFERQADELDLAA